MANIWIIDSLWYSDWSCSQHSRTVNESRSSQTIQLKYIYTKAEIRCMENISIGTLRQDVSTSCWRHCSKVMFKLLWRPFEVVTSAESRRQWRLEMRRLIPYHRHPFDCVHFLVAAHQPNSRVVTDESDDYIALWRNNHRALDNWVNSIPCRKPAENIQQPFVVKFWMLIFKLTYMFPTTVLTSERDLWRKRTV